MARKKKKKYLAHGLLPPTLFGVSCRCSDGFVSKRTGNFPGREAITNSWVRGRSVESHFFCRVSTIFLGLMVNPSLSIFVWKGGCPFLLQEHNSHQKISTHSVTCLFLLLAFVACCSPISISVGTFWFQSQSIMLGNLFRNLWMNSIFLRMIHCFKHIISDISVLMSRGVIP